jgi:hypothetical protein
MRKHVLIKAIALLLSWFTFSPLLLILDGHWKLLPKWLRVVLFVLSPMMLIIVVVLALLVQADYSYYSRRHFVKSDVIENITGVSFPKYTVVERRSIWCDYFMLEFERMPDEAFYKELDEHFDCFEPGEYSFSAIWGNGIEAPKGESDKDDISFSIDIARGSKTFHIRVGEW